MWFAIVGKRTLHGTTAARGRPRRSRSFEASAWSSPSRTASRSSALAPLLVLDPAGVGDLAAAGGVERRALELGLELPVVAVRSAPILVRTSVFS